MNNVVAAKADSLGARSEALNQAISRLREALVILDANEVSPDVGALLQETIIRLERVERL